jgi:NADH-quinone oxidoreductase subunit J
MIQVLVFYVFAFVLIASAIMVVASRNPVHAVLFLILCFFNAAGLFMLMGAEFLAMTLIIVYVGAVAVLFLFVVMMLDIDFRQLRQGFMSYLPLGALVGVIILVQLVMVVGFGEVGNLQLNAAIEGLQNGPANDVDNTTAIGKILYTDYVYPFQIAGLVLLVAMIGAIVLTLRQRPGVRKQKPSQQLDRQRSEVVEVRKVQSGGGVP